MTERSLLKNTLGTLTPLQWGVVMLSLTLTLFAWQSASQISEEKARDQFEHQVQQITALLEDRMGKYAFALISGVGAMQAGEDHLTLAEWRNFSQSLALPEKLPGINGTGVIFRVSPDNLTAFIAGQRELRPNFSVHPNHQNNDYWPITFIEPEASNQAAVGLDMAHEANRYQAALKAMRTGETQITGPIVLVQDSEKTPGFLFFQPFYESLSTPPSEKREPEFQGLIYAPFIMHRLMDGSLANINRRVQLRISDDNAVLYDELKPSAGNYDPDPMFEKTTAIPMYGRNWTFNIQTTKLFKTYNTSRQPGAILAAGLTINAFIVFVFILLSGAKARAEHRAADMTRHFDNEASKLKAVLDTVSEAVITTNARGYIETLNPAAVRMFGKHRLGKHIVDLFAGNLAGENLNRSRFETVAFGRNQETFSAHVSVGRAELDSETIYTYTVRDLSTEKLADLAKNQFISTVSHELRTPLTAISGAAGLLKHQFEKNTQISALKMVGIIDRNSERLSLLIADLLDFEGFESGSLRISRTHTDLSPIVRKATNDCSTYASSFGVTLAFDDQSSASHVCVDQNRISQVVLNLVSNAIKFSSSGSTVNVQIINDSPDIVSVKVVDSGQGIPETYREHAFGRFSQVDASDVKRKSGTGLGLSICKTIIELHNGTIDYCSTLGEGSTFFFCLSVEKEETTV